MPSSTSSAAASAASCFSRCRPIIPRTYPPFVPDVRRARRGPAVRRRPPLLRVLYGRGVGGLGARCGDRAFDLRRRLLRPGLAAASPARRGREDLPLRRRRRPLHPRDHDRAGRAAVDRGARFDCHLMVAEPERHFESVQAAGGDSVTFHVEAAADPGRTVRLAREHGLGVGVAFNPETPVARAARAAEGADLGLCMSIHPGLSGETFMPEALGRIAELRRLLPDGVLVQVDGGVNATNLRRVREAGADLLSAGSAVFWQDDPVAAYRRLVELLSAEQAPAQAAAERAR